MSADGDLGSSMPPVGGDVSWSMPSATDKAAHPERAVVPLSDSQALLVRQLGLTDEDMPAGWTGPDSEPLEGEHRPGVNGAEHDGAGDESAVQVEHSYEVPYSLADDGVTHAVLNEAAALDIPESAMSVLLQAYEREQNLEEQAWERHDRASLASARAEVNERWGTQAEGNIRAISGLRAIMPPGMFELVVGSRYPNGTAAGNDADSLEFLLKIAEAARRGAL